MREEIELTISDALRAKYVGKLVKGNSFSFRFDDDGTHRVVDISISFSEAYSEDGCYSYDTYSIDLNIETLNGTNRRWVKLFI